MASKSSIQLLILLSALLNATLVMAAATNAETVLETGKSMYEAGDYDQVIALLKDAIADAPDNAEYHHLIAKSYGHAALKVNWFKAMDYAKKTRDHLQTAVKLDPNNVAYLDDLMDYYREAPAFLGGDKRKADEIASKIRQIEQLSQNQIHSYSY